MSNSNPWTAAAVAIALAALTACGGGGSSGDASGTAGGSPNSGSAGSDGSGGSGGGSPSGGTPLPEPKISFAAAAGKSGVIGVPIDVQPAIALAGITSCGIKPGSANEQTFVDVGFTVDDTSCAIGGTPQVLLPPTQFTITATAGAATEDAEVTLAVTLPRAAFAFVAQHGLDSVAVYSLDPVTGDMSLASVTPTGTGSRPHAASVDPARRFLYVAKSGTARIGRYAVDAASGALASQADTDTFDTPLRLAIDPVGRFLFALHGGADPKVSSYRIDPSDGSLTAADQFQVGSVQHDLAVDRTGRFLFVTTSGSGLHRLTIDQTTGHFSASHTVAILVSSLAIHPLHRGLYAASLATSEVNYFPSAAGTAGLGPTEFFTAGGAGKPVLKALTFDPEGRFLYAANSTTSRIDSYAVDPASGQIQAAGSITLAAGCDPEVLSLDPMGRFLRAACSDASGTIFTIGVERANGALTLVSSSAASGAAPKSIETVSSSARFLYAAHAANDEIGIYSLDPHTGEWSAETALAVQTVPAALTVDRGGRHLYAVSVSGDLGVFAIEPITGGLSPAGGEIGGGHAGGALVIDPTGRFAYVPNAAASFISRYAVDAAAGTLAGRADLPSVAGPSGIAFHPSGLYAYVISHAGQSVTMYHVDRVTGDLTPFSSPLYSVAGPPIGIAVDATGRFVYIGLGGGGDTIASFSVDLANGGLHRTWQALDGGAGFGSPADSLTLDPTGRYLYVGSSNPDRLEMFGIDRNQASNDPGALTSLDSRAISGSAFALLADPTGRALYAAPAADSPGLSSFFVDRSISQIGSEVTTPVAAPASSIAIAP